MKLYVLILSLPTQNSTARMRVWRALKSCGAAVLRDGVYILPEFGQLLDTFQSIASDVMNNEGTALILTAQPVEPLDLALLFDRREDYEKLAAQIHQVSSELRLDKKDQALKQSRKLRKSFQALADIDFFAGELQVQVAQQLTQLEIAIARLGEPDEPAFAAGHIPRHVIEDFQKKIWATRQRPWVDRLACAWLIRRFIDPQAQFIWLSSPADCPQNAIGFDFDGATFSHVDNLVSFEVLIESFSLAQPALKRLAGIVHFLDVGGLQPAEAIGIEKVLRGLQQNSPDDDQLLGLASYVFDGLYASFKGENP